MPRKRHRSVQRQEAATERYLSQPPIPLSLPLSFSPFLSSSLSTAVLHREHRLLARARPTTRVNLVCIWSGPVRLAGVQSMDVIHCSATESQADGRTDGRVGEEGREERSRGRDTASKAIVAADLCRETNCYRWHRYGYTYGGTKDRTLVFSVVSLFQ